MPSGAVDLCALLSDSHPTAVGDNASEALHAPTLSNVRLRRPNLGEPGGEESPGRRNLISELFQFARPLERGRVLWRGTETIPVIQCGRDNPHKVSRKIGIPARRRRLRVVTT